MNKTIVYETPQMVSVRKYEIDICKLKNLLKTKKKESGLSSKQIANILHIPITKVEHYFRSDNSFAIPDKDLWDDLKTLLRINTDEFDKPIKVFIEKENIYESANRCYFEDGIAPTLTNNCGDDNYIVRDNS